MFSYKTRFLNVLGEGNVRITVLGVSGKERMGEKRVERRKGKVGMGKKNVRKTWLELQEEGPATLNVDHIFVSSRIIFILLATLYTLLDSKYTFHMMESSLVYLFFLIQL